MRNRERRRWLALAAAVVGVLVLGAVTFWPVISGGDLQTSANSAQLTGGFLLAAAVAVSAWFVQVRQKSQQARAVPGPEDVERAAAVLARLMERQWREEAALRSLDDPDPIPVTWQVIRDPGLMDHPVNIERTAAAASGAMQWQASSADVAALADRFRSTRRRRVCTTGWPTDSCGTIRRCAPPNSANRPSAH